MLFARVASFLFAILTFGLFALGNPVPEAEKRAVNPTTIVNNLQTKVNSLTGQLKGITTNTPQNEILAQSVVTQIVTAIEEANSQAEGGGLLKRQTADAVADVLAAVVSDVGTVLAPVVVIIPILGPLVTEIDVALNGLVVSLDVVVAGLVDTLDSLLVGVAGILNGLGLTVLLATLGL